MPATATAPTNGIANPTENTDDKPTRRGNPLMRGLTSNMLKHPHELEFADGMMSDEFALEKISRQVIEALDLQTEKEAIDVIKKAWAWHSDKEKREAEAAADRILAEAANNVLLLQILEKKILDQKKAA